MVVSWPVMLVVGVGSVDAVWVLVFGGVSEAVLPLLVTSIVCVGREDQVLLAVANRLTLSVGIWECVAWCVVVW